MVRQIGQRVTTLVDEAAVIAEPVRELRCRRRQGWQNVCPHGWTSSGSAVCSLYCSRQIAHSKAEPMLQLDVGSKS